MRQAVEGSDTSDIVRLCHRIRAAGAPGGKARPKLLGEYRRLAEEFGCETDEIETGRDLERAASSLLRTVAGRQRGGHTVAPAADSA